MTTLRPGRGSCEPARRRFGLGGVVIGVVALFGVDLLVSSKVGPRLGRSAAGIVQVVGSTDAAVLARSLVATCVLALAFLLWLGRRDLFESPRPLPVGSVGRKTGDSTVVHILRGRFARHYATGGLYGP